MITGVACQIHTAVAACTLKPRPSTSAAVRPQRAVPGSSPSGSKGGLPYPPLATAAAITAMPCPFRLERRRSTSGFKVRSTDRWRRFDLRPGSIFLAHAEATGRLEFTERDFDPVSAPTWSCLRFDCAADRGIIALADALVIGVRDTRTRHGGAADPFRLFLSVFSAGRCLFHVMGSLPPVSTAGLRQLRHESGLTSASAAARSSGRLGSTRSAVTPQAHGRGWRGITVSQPQRRLVVHPRQSCKI